MVVKYDRTYSSETFAKPLIPRTYGAEIRNTEQQPLAISTKRRYEMAQKSNQLKIFDDDIASGSPLYYKHDKQEIIYMSTRQGSSNLKVEDRSMDSSNKHPYRSPPLFLSSERVLPKQSWTTLMLRKAEASEAKKRRDLENAMYLGNNADDLRDIDNFTVSGNMEITYPRLPEHQSKFYKLDNDESDELVFKKISPSPVLEGELEKKMRKKMNKERAEIKDNNIEIFKRESSKQENILVQREWKRKRHIAIQNFKKEQELILKGWVESTGKPFLNGIHKEFRSHLDCLYGQFETCLEDTRSDYLIFKTKLDNGQMEKDECFLDELNKFWVKENKMMNGEWEEQNVASLKSLKEESDAMQNVIISERVTDLKNNFGKKWQRRIDYKLNTWIEEKADIENKEKDNLDKFAYDNTASLGSEKTKLLTIWEKEVSGFNSEFQQRVENIKSLIKQDYDTIKKYVEKGAAYKINVGEKESKYRQTMLDAWKEDCKKIKGVDVTQIYSTYALDEWEKNAKKLNDLEKSQRKGDLRKASLMKQKVKLQLGGKMDDGIIIDKSTEDMINSWMKSDRYERYVAEARELINCETAKITQEMEEDMRGNVMFPSIPDVPKVKEDTAEEKVKVDSKSLPSYANAYDLLNKISTTTSSFTSIPATIDTNESLSDHSVIANPGVIIARASKKKSSLKGKSSGINKLVQESKDEDSEHEQHVGIPLTKSVSFVDGDLKINTNKINAHDANDPPKISVSVVVTPAPRSIPSFEPLVWELDANKVKASSTANNSNNNRNEVIKGTLPKLASKLKPPQRTGGVSGKKRSTESIQTQETPERNI